MPPHPDRRLERQAALRELLKREELDALLVTHPANIRYLTGFSGSAALLLVTPDATVFVSDFRYEVQAAAEVEGAAVIEIDQRNVWNRLTRVLEAGAVGVLGVEGASLTLRDRDRLSAARRMRIVSTADLVERLRAVKSPEEVAAIRAAAALAHDALADILPTVRPGRSEQDIATDLEAALRRRGSEWHPFPTTVASGPRSALPHARSSARIIERGEFLLLDFGAMIDGYCADLTRTVVVGGRADARQRTVYETVRDAQRRAIDGLRAGMSGREGDALARDLIAARGFGEAFGHGLGHGLGLEVHEAPRVSPVAEAPLPAHTVVTVEPGIYLPGWGGVRLEDDVYLAPEGPLCLSDGQTELIELV